jgi:chromosome segregation ATPase
MNHQTKTLKSKLNEREIIIRKIKQDHSEILQDRKFLQDKLLKTTSNQKQLMQKVKDRDGVILKYESESKQLNAQIVKHTFRHEEMETKIKNLNTEKVQLLKASDKLQSDKEKLHHEFERLKENQESLTLFASKINKMREAKRRYKKETHNLRRFLQELQQKLLMKEHIIGVQRNDMCDLKRTFAEEECKMDHANEIYRQSNLDLTDRLKLSYDQLKSVEDQRDELIQKNEVLQAANTLYSK